ncbi:hypothetical protein BC939DRAFT_477850 [Gamsiella multidivaricata]|uniref:uncharacterized protein n=1 Tax=Gamsiella multidivaricata TaxID=101098 RepID=UPI00221F994D|nr:uncharacterized protein BC939DRAFT_477850 [Gamsiella multidivaricata]KAI7822393.1 hypothetical protein BC939DRAFT_477850 [Gamsiella multidivaricata]
MPVPGILKGVRLQEKYVNRVPGRSLLKNNLLLQQHLSTHATLNSLPHTRPKPYTAPVWYTLPLLIIPSIASKSKDGTFTVEPLHPKFAKVFLLNRVDYLRPPKNYIVSQAFLLCSCPPCERSKRQQDSICSLSFCFVKEQGPFLDPKDLFSMFTDSGPRPDPPLPFLLRF